MASANLAPLPSHIDCQTMNVSSCPQPIDMLIVGAGFTGLYMLHKARSMGLTVQVIEAAPSVGGTWYHNRYPGARVDIESLEYSYSFAEELQQDWRWSERYAAQPELLKYANHVADRFHLRDGIALNTRLLGAAFDESADRWIARTSTGATWAARFMVMACGPLSSPNTPAFKGLKSFKGPVLHTAHWPHEGVDFAGQRVAVVGTGSSGVQAIPIIAKQARELTVFQRTATYAVPAHNGALAPDYEAHIKADYAGFRARNRRMRTGFGSEQALNNKSVFAATPEEREAEFEKRWQIGGFCLLGAYNDLMVNGEANQIAAEFVRGKIRAIVRDKATAQTLSPAQFIGCKRLCVDTGYYNTFNRPNVKLVDISQQAIDEITPNGLRVADREYKFDVLVLATGFDAMTGTLMKLDLRGRGGVSIQEKWQAGPLNYLGLTVNGFPNFFNPVGPGGTSAFTNVIVAIEHHVELIANVVAHMRAHGLCTIEPSLQAEADWVAHVSSMAAQTIYLGCNSWYLGANVPGKPRMFMPLTGGFPAYVAKCGEAFARGYEGFVLA